jgi:hypothetical protein
MNIIVKQIITKVLLVLVLAATTVVETHIPVIEPHALKNPQIPCTI